MSQLSILEQGLRHYVEGHIETGSFLRCVLENDLSGAVLRGDPTSVVHLRDLVLWLQSFAPPECWGSPERVRDWLAARKCRASLHPANGGPVIARCSRPIGHSEEEHAGDGRTWRSA